MVPVALFGTGRVPEISDIQWRLCWKEMSNNSPVIDILCLQKCFKMSLGTLVTRHLENGMWIENRKCKWNRAKLSYRRFFNSKYKDWKGEKINLKNKVMLVNLRLKRLNLKVEWNNVWMKEMIWKWDVLGLKKKNIVDKVLKMRKLLEVEMCVE